MLGVLGFADFAVVVVVVTGDAPEYNLAEDVPNFLVGFAEDKNGVVVVEGEVVELESFVEEY